MPDDPSNTNDPDRSRPSHGSGRRRLSRNRRPLKELFSPGDWIYVPPGPDSDLDIFMHGGYGRVIAVRDSEIEVDFGRPRFLTGPFGRTIPGSAISSIEKVDGPESGHPGRPYGGPDGPDVYVTLDERHGIYAGKRGRLAGGIALVDGPPDGHNGQYFQVEFSGDLKPIWIQEECVYGRCRNSTYHPKLWYYKDR